MPSHGRYPDKLHERAVQGFRDQLVHQLPTLTGPSRPLDRRRGAARRCKNHHASPHRPHDPRHTNVYA